MGPFGRRLSLAGMFLCALAGVYAAAVIHVPADYPTINEAVTASGDGDTILVADGVYGQTLISNKPNLTIRSVNGPENCIIETSEEKGVDIGSSGVTFDGFRVRNAQTYGIIAYTSNVIRNCIVEHIGDNMPCLGIRVRYRSSSDPPLLVENCIIRNLYGYSFGISFHGPAQIINTEFSNLSTAFYLSFVNVNMSASVSNCLIHDVGSLVYPSQSMSFQFEATNCRFIRYLHAISPKSEGNYNFSNCLFQDGNFKLLYTGNPIGMVIKNCTFAHNLSFDIDVRTNIVVFENCIFRDNQDDYVFDGENIRIDHSIIDFPWSGEGVNNINQDPLFVKGPEGHFYLSQIASGQAADSPAVNWGSDKASVLGFDTLTTRTDQMPDTDAVDIGYHYTPVGPIASDYTDDWRVDYDDFSSLAGMWGNTDITDVAFMGEEWLTDLIPADLIDWDLNLTHYYPLDQRDGNNVPSISYYQYFGAIMGSAEWRPYSGRVRGALSFDGTDDTVITPNVSDISPLILTRLPLTLSCWIRPDADALGKMSLIETGERIDTHNGAWLSVDFGSEVTQLSAAFGDASSFSSAGRRSKVADVTMPLDQWHHVAVTMIDVNTINIYLNGQDVGGVYSGTATRLLQNSSSYLGSRAGIANFFKGLMDEVRIYKRALTPAEIQALANP